MLVLVGLLSTAEILQFDLSGQVAGLHLQFSFGGSSRGGLLLLIAILRLLLLLSKEKPTDGLGHGFTAETVGLSLLGGRCN